jgi:hypothetical protein
VSARSEISTTLLPPRLPVLGHVKIGGLGATRKSAQGTDFQPPEKYDFFRITTRTRGPDRNFLRDEAVHRAIGEKPTELDVRLPFDTRAENLYAQMLQYSGRTRVRECDGEESMDPRTQVGQICERARGKECACKPYARLSVILEAAPTCTGRPRGRRPTPCRRSSGSSSGIWAPSVACPCGWS